MINTYDNKLAKHERLVDELYDRLYYSKIIRYDTLKKHKEYCYGEIDVIATINDRILLFEVKSNNSKHLRKKARNQLQRSKLFYSESGRITKFLYTPDGLEYIL